MHIVLVGLDHQTAPLALRERLACSKRQVAQLLQASREVGEESVLLSTCNRLELYAVCDSPREGSEALKRVLCREREIAFEELSVHAYTLSGPEAVSHLMQVTCGLLSLVPGEPQIQGQVVEALEVAQGGGYAGPILSALFRAAIVTGKRARSETEISRNAVSMSHVAVQLTRRLVPDLSQACVVLLGSGEMSELAARNLRDNGAGRLIILNRTQQHAMTLAQSLDAEYRPFSELAATLVEADVVISSTRAPVALITPILVQAVHPQRKKDRPLLLIDLALPRDIDPAVARFPGVHVYNMDDLQEEVEKGLQLRRQEMLAVQAIIVEEEADFARWLASLGVVDTILALRQSFDHLREQELARTLRMLPSSMSSKERAAVQELSVRLINKILHQPMASLKEAAAMGNGYHYTEAVRYLFGLEQVNNERDSSWDSSEQTGARSDESCRGYTPAAASQF